MLLQARRPLAEGRVEVFLLTRRLALQQRDLLGHVQLDEHRVRLRGLQSVRGLSLIHI